MKFVANIIPQLPYLRRFARSLTENQANADDLVQCTAEKALKMDKSFLGKGSYRAWLFTILYRTFLDQQMRFQRLNETSLEMVTDISAPETMVERAELRQVTILLQKLPEEQRATLTLVAVEGFSYEEVGKMMNVPIGTVMSRLYRARLKLKNLMGEKKLTRLEIVT